MEEMRDNVIIIWCICSIITVFLFSKIRDEGDIDKNLIAYITLIILSPISLIVLPLLFIFYEIRIVFRITNSKIYKELTKERKWNR